MQKIGHAFSVSGFHENFESMVKSTYNALELFSYGDHIRKGNLNFNVEKYSNSLKQMISKLEGRQVEDIVDQKIAELKTAGLDLKSRSTVEIDPNTKRGVFIPFTFERFKKEYMNGINQNLASIKEISRNIEIITKFDDKGLPDGFKNGAWIKEFFDTQQSPIEYAKRHSITIEGMEASAWKEREDAKMIAKAQGENKQPSPLVDNKQQPEARSTESQKEKTTQGIQLATLEDAKMIAKAQGENKQPTPLVDNKQQPEARSTESQKEQTATKDNQQGVPLTSTPLWKEKLEKISQKDKEQQAIKKIEGHTEEFAKGPQDRKAIKQLYGKIVDALETGGAIIPAHATYMKKDEGYKEGFMKEHVDTAEKLLKTELKKCSTSDKINYKVADFCNNIGLKKIGNYFMKKVSEESKKIIATVESNIVKNIVQNIGQVFENKLAEKSKIDAIASKLSVGKKQTGARDR